ncbi:MAG: hypothetical protein AAB414_03415 [Patescibacteria group bacterium]
MIRKIEEYNKALDLRRKGKSIRAIAKLLSISPATASSWCKPIKLSPKQIENLLKSRARISHLRRLAKIKHQKSLIKVAEIMKKSKAEISNLTDKEFFLVGLSLYWAEGFKSLKEKRLGFCNTDPKMIKFMIKWFKKAIRIKSEDFILRTEFNESHRDRTGEIKNFWSRITNIPLNQFEKPFYHRSTWLRNYSNRDKYYGVLRIRVRKSSELLNKTRGWISGLASK